MTVKSVFKVLLKIFAGLLIFSLLVIGFFIGINLNDQPPSEAAIEFQQAWDNRAPVNDEDNGYMYALGFDTTEQLDPKKTGLERAQWIKEKISLGAVEALTFPGEVYEFEKHLPPEIKQLVNHCNEVNLTCISAVRRAQEQINALSNTENLLLNRYQKLIMHPAWREEAGSVNLPFLNYGELIKAQRLTFIRVMAMQEKSPSNIFKIIDDDLHFWRMVLRDTDFLITKMIAVAAIKNNFLWTNKILLQIDKAAISMSIPQVMQQPFTFKEVSIQRWIIGEWIFAYNSDMSSLDSHSLIEKVSARLFYKKQDTMNRMAERLKALHADLDVSFKEFESTFIQYRQRPEREYSWFDYVSNPYNPAGQILMQVDPVSLYTGYLARARDLENFRLGLLASIELMGSSQLDPNTLTDRSLYKSKPWVIDEQKRTVSVTGLGVDSRPVQTYYY